MNTQESTEQSWLINGFLVELQQYSYSHVVKLIITYHKKVSGHVPLAGDEMNMFLPELRSGIRQ
jgi:hypothetical protein